VPTMSLAVPVGLNSTQRAHYRVDRRCSWSGTSISSPSAGPGQVLADPIDKLESAWEAASRAGRSICFPPTIHCVRMRFIFSETAINYRVRRRRTSSRLARALPGRERPLAA
jgi:hypothetical protein